MSRVLIKTITTFSDWPGPFQGEFYKVKGVMYKILSVKHKCIPSPYDCETDELKVLKVKDRGQSYWE